MAKKSIDLLTKTDPNWVNIILENFDLFLADHANCERKASSLAMSFVVRYADRHKIIPTLIDLAVEELDHFQQVFKIMQARKVHMIPDSPDEYVNQLMKHMKHGRDDRFLDQLLVASLIECRGAERFRIISEAVSDPALKTFYRDLWAAEAKHGHVFADMALNYHEEETVYNRLHELAIVESEIITKLKWKPSLH